jgi:hypothetical protein
MGAESTSDALSDRWAVFFVLLPIIGGGTLFLLFESGDIHRLGLFLMGAGVVVGSALLLLGMQ